MARVPNLTWRNDMFPCPPENVLQRIVTDTGVIFDRQRLQDYSFFQNYRYFCPKCSGVLSNGPEGGVSVNAVCRKCEVNYGNLPDYHGDAGHWLTWKPEPGLLKRLQIWWRGRR